MAAGCLSTVSLPGEMVCQPHSSENQSLRARTAAQLWETARERTMGQSMWNENASGKKKATHLMRVSATQNTYRTMN